MLKTRVMTAVLGIPVLLLLLYLGGAFWSLLFIVLALLALHEYLSLMKNEGALLYIPSYYLMLLLLLQDRIDFDTGLMVFIGVLLFALEMVFRYPRVNLADAARCFFGAFYIGFLFHYAFAMAEMDRPFETILLTLLLTWANDVGAYFAGTLWGRHRFSTGLSPNKTWEGCIGGLLLTVAIACIFSLFFAMPNASIAYLILLGIVASLAAQLGDLVESGMKRYAGVKDAGQILPGHGGILDRFDSLMLVLPVVYYFSSLLIH